MVLILIAFALAVFGLVQIGRTLTGGQRVALVLVFVLGLVWLMFWLVNAGWLGQATAK